MGDEAKLADEVGIHSCARFVVGAAEVSGDCQTCASLGGAKEVEDSLVAVERLPGPVLGDFREQAMLDGIPLGGAGAFSLILTFSFATVHNTPRNANRDRFD